MNPIYLTDSQQAEYDEITKIRILREDKTEKARLKRNKYTAEYQKEHKEWVNDYQKTRYNTNAEYRNTKRLQSAYARYLDGKMVSNKLVDDMKDAGYDREMPYRKRVY